jgi:hypothetical protein
MELVALTEPQHSVCVYCASSRVCDARYHDVARRLGGLLADAGWCIVYGGGRSGSNPEIEVWSSVGRLDPETMEPIDEQALAVVP